MNTTETTKIYQEVDIISAKLSDMIDNIEDISEQEFSDIMLRVMNKICVNTQQIPLS